MSGSRQSLESNQIRLEMTSRIEMLQTADVLVSHLARVAGFDDNAVDDIRVALDESVVNAILHGNRLDATKRVTLEVALLPGSLELRIQDEGGGFDPASVPDPLAPENMLRTGGRGILLMRSLMDEVRFSRSAKGGTELTLVKVLLGATREPERGRTGEAPPMSENPLAQSPC